MAASLTGVFAAEMASVEEPALAVLAELGWHRADLGNEKPGPGNPTGRTSFRQTWLPGRLRAALTKLNPNVPPEALTLAEDELTRDRSAMLPVAANRDVHKLLRAGVAVDVRRDDGSGFDTHRVQVIDWTDPTQNDFLAAQQVWIASASYTRRPDTIGFVNGLPLLIAEWKGLTQPLAEAYDKNLRDYRDTIPALFDAHGFVVLSNGHQTVMGGAHAPLDAFAAWKRLEEGGGESERLERLLQGACRPDRFLDIIENFTLFEEARGGLRKIVGKYHQVLGVNRALEAVAHAQENAGRLGVFWHTQGSGKSLSMAMFAEKVLRRQGGNYTFVIVTDRVELDDQIAGTFAAIGALSRNVPQVQAGSRAHLRELLAGNERYVFTLIHKFSTADQEAMPVLSDRSDIIVITDEAHRSQYDQLAANMRAALPNASFIGFTGTPLIKGQESRTREVFGDYVSIYDFAQSVKDGATVPLFYEARKPELQLNAEELRDEMDALLDAAALDDEQEKRLQREFGRAYHLITREDRLEKVADDLAAHIAARGYRGKAMFVAIDKATAVNMHGKVKEAVARLIIADEARLSTVHEAEGAMLIDRLEWMRSLDMAVVVSQGQNEIADLKAKGLDIGPHRKRMQDEDLEAKFKDPVDPLRLVFVCAMWITGFDVPSVSTIYLDKPMKNHTLMQTIARANRRAVGKTAGVIVDYVGVFQNLQKALAIYAGAVPGEPGPIKDKVALVAALEASIKVAEAFALAAGVDTGPIIAATPLDRQKLIGNATEALVAPDERRREFLRLVGAVERAYKALMPDERAAPFLKPVAMLHIIAGAVRAKIGPADISAITAQIEALLDDKIEGVAILAPIITGDLADGRVDLSSIDFEKLATLFAVKPKTATEKLREAAEDRAKELADVNPSRIDLVEKLEKMVDEYNAGAIDPQRFFDWLKDFIDQLSAEGERAAKEGLNENELAIYDLLTRPEPKLTKAQEIEVKKVARDLLERLQVLVGAVDWTKGQQTRGAVFSEIRVKLNALPEEPYPEDMWNAKVNAVWDFVRQQYGDRPSRAQ